MIDVSVSALLRANPGGPVMIPPKLLIVLILATALATHAAAQTIHLAADFDDKVIDAPIGVGGPELGEPVRVDGAVLAVVRDQPMPTPGLELSDNHDYAAGHVVFEFLDDAEIVSGFVTIRFDVCIPMTPTNCGYSVGVREHDGASRNFTDLGFTADGWILAYNTDYQSIVIGPWEPGETHGLAICHDLEAGTYDIWLDGFPALTDEPHGITDRGVGRVSFGCDHDVDLEGRFVVDNVLVTDEELEVVAVPELAAAPRARLHPAMPNPFNPATSICFDLPGPTVARLRIHDLTGRRVITLVDDWLPAGGHRVRWNGRDQRGRAMPSGVYLLGLEVADRVTVQSLTLVR